MSIKAAATRASSRVVRILGSLSALRALVGSSERHLGGSVEAVDQAASFGVDAPQSATPGSAAMDHKGTRGQAVRLAARRCSSLRAR